MPMAYMLLNTEIRSENEVLGAPKKIDVVEEAYIIYGVYVVVAKIKVDTMGKLNRCLTRETTGQNSINHNHDGDRGNKAVSTRAYIRELAYDFV